MSGINRHTQYRKERYAEYDSNHQCGNGPDGKNH